MRSPLSLHGFTKAFLRFFCPPVTKAEGASNKPVLVVSRYAGFPILRPSHTHKRPAKGRSKKLALIAVCNKLLKQAFAKAQSGMIYDPNYVPRKVLSMKC